MQQTFLAKAHYALLKTEQALMKLVLEYLRRRNTSASHQTTIRRNKAYWGVPKANSTWPSQTLRGRGEPYLAITNLTLP